MSISPIGGASPVQNNVATSNVSKPESKDVPGAADHDHDSDRAGTTAAAAKASSPGRVNVKA